MVWKNGGLISNLKVSENLFLPVHYHPGHRIEEAEERLADIFRRIGLPLSPDYLHRLPGPLSISEKSLIGMARAMLMEPELMIYDSVFEGLQPERAEKVRRLAEEFHRERPGRVSLYVSSDEGSLRNIQADLTRRQAGKGWIE